MDGMRRRSLWWLAEDEDVGREVTSVVDALVVDDGWREIDAVEYARYYGTPICLGPNEGYVRPSSERRGHSKYNVCKALVDAVLSQLYATKPRPLPLTSGARWDLKRKARKLGKFLVGQLHATNYYRERERIALDMALFGTGIGKVWAEGDQVRFERVPWWNVHVDEFDALEGRPRALYQKAWADKDMLIALYAEGAKNERMRDAIWHADGHGTHATRIRVEEAWRLPSAAVDVDDGKRKRSDGRHVIAAGGVALRVEEWTRDHFPFAFMRLLEPVSGMWGSGILEEVVGTQLQINWLLRHIDTSIKTWGVPTMYLQGGGASLPSATFRNDVGRIVRLPPGVAPPQVVANNVITAEVVNQLARLKQEPFEIFGVNTLSANGMKPAGINSGVALQTWLDSGSTRLGSVFRSDEQFAVDVGLLQILAAQEIYTEHGSYSVRAPSKFLESIDWKDINLKRDQYELQVFPVNLLATQPAQRLQQIQDMMGAGILSKPQALALLDFPDIDSILSLETANMHMVELIVESLEEGRYLGPEPTMDLQFMIPMIQFAAVRAEVDGLPGDRLDDFRGWLLEADRLLKRGQATEAPTAPAGPPGAEEALPEALSPEAAMPPAMPA
jgi:hypothetical protein